MIGLITGIINSLDTSNLTNEECITVLIIILTALYNLKQQNPTKFAIISGMCSKMLAGVKFKNFVAYVKLMGTSQFIQMLQLGTHKN